MKLESTMVTNRMDATNVFGAEVRPGQPVEAQKCPVRPSRRPSRRPSSGVRRRPSSVVRRRPSSVVRRRPSFVQT